MKIYLPWLGEFGSEVLKYAPIIYADKEDKTVFHEEGKEAIYPHVTKRVVIPKIKEKERHCAGSPLQVGLWAKIRHEYGTAFDYVTPTTTPPIQIPREFFHPQPLKRYDIETDIVVFPRWRHTAKQMNWPHWKELVSLLKVEGFSVFAAGTRDMSFDLDCPCAWDYDRELDASICAIENSKLRLGLMTALNVISLMCERPPWIILASNGMRSPIRPSPVNFQYLQRADHKQVSWKILPCWDDVSRIFKEVKTWLNTQS